MKQSTLNFSSAKRAGSSSTAKPKTSSSHTSKEGSSLKLKDKVVKKEDNVDDETANVSVRPKPDDIEVETPTAGRTTRSSSKKVTITPEKSLKVPEEPSSEAVKTPEDVIKANVKEEDVPELPDLNVKNPKYRKIYAEVKEKMGGLPAIHGEKQNRIHDILRIFDNSYEYGPCVGISRRDRWDRAQALGLNPPIEIDDILNTKEGTTLTEYSQSVFYGEV